MLRAPKILLALFVAFLVSCGTGPRVTIGISHPAKGGLSCFDARTGESFFTEYKDTDKWVCLPPEDARTLLEFCARK